MLSHCSACSPLVVLCVSCILVLAACGCASGGARVEQAAYGPWSECWKLSNGDAELVVAPQTGRIVHYGFAGGPNVLWVSPQADQPQYLLGGWKNWGGDKIWIWPQEEWPKYGGQGWPPPADAAVQAYAVEVLDGDTLRMTSQPVPGYNLRIVRDIRMAPSGTAVTITSRLEKVAGLEPPATASVGLWNVVQVPAPDPIFARLAPGASGQGWADMKGQTPLAPAGREGNVLILRRPKTSAKIGLDADLLAGLVGDVLFVQEMGGDVPMAGYEPAVRSQVYIEPQESASRPPGLVPYVELEMTGPRQLLSGGTLPRPLVQEWSLHRIPADEQTPESLARKVGAGAGGRPASQPRG